MSTIDDVMAAAEKFAECEVNISGDFAVLSAYRRWDAAKNGLRELIAAALADAERKGAEAMREACADEVEIRDCSDWSASRIADMLRALHRPTGGQS